MSNPLQQLGSDLNQVQSPVRYIGGEYGQTVKSQADITFVMAFPDLYEIGMCNQAVKIIYNGLNAIPNVRCERVFAPDIDFEILLKSKNIPLYTLETAIPLSKTDIIGFSIGYELGISGVLSILDCGQVPLLHKDRTEADPIVLAGGCGVTNPIPLSNFFDGVFIGEAEPELFKLIEQLGQLKKQGKNRSQLLKVVHEHPHIWIPGKKTNRAVYSNFGQEPTIESFMPIANCKIIHDHGVVEIMRGCPNGCRFCHAGIYYRPQRLKSMEAIIDEVDNLVYKAGYREISLTSLSSGDYEDVGTLLDILNKRYEGQNISFQLPSLKVNSFTLPILEKVSTVRKSGLTFAIETPVEAWQFALNKEVFEEKIYDIIMAAKKRGWNKAKFYFMIGLPIEQLNGKNEEEEIVDFLIKIQNATRIQCNVNVGTFIPKPHTPYQWVKQLSPSDAEKKLLYIRQNLPRGRFRVSTHDVYTGFLEGMISRGDERVGDLLLLAWQKGCRLDAWENHLKKEIWQDVIDNAGWNVESEILRERDIAENLPWDEISLGVSKQFLIKEYKKSQTQTLTKKCQTDCKDRCGVCNKDVKVQILNKKSDDVLKKIINENKTIQSRDNMNIKVLWRVIFQFEKKNKAEFLSHLALVETFHKCFLRSKLDILHTDGFNPVPRLELASSLSIGITSEAEIGSILLREKATAEEFTRIINLNLPDFIQIKRAYIFPVTNLKKRESLASSFWGCEYQVFFKKFEQQDNQMGLSDFIHSLSSSLGLQFDLFILQENKLLVQLPFAKDKAFRVLISEYFGCKWFEVVSMHKTNTFALLGEAVVSYFDLFKNIAKIHMDLIEANNYQSFL